MTSLIPAVVLALLLQPPAKPEEPKTAPPAPPTSPTAPATTPAPAASSPAAPAPTPAAVTPEERIAHWREDLAFLASELPKLHKNAFFKCKKEDFEAAVAALDKELPTLADHQIVVGMMKIAAMLGDFHTGIGPGGLKPPFHFFPVSFAVFSDGPVIGAARESQKDLIGCTIVKVGDTPIDAALKRAAAVIGYENEATFKSQSPRLLAMAEVAHAVGLIPTTDKMTLVVSDTAGEERTVELTPMAEGEKLATKELEASKLPLSRQKRGTVNWYELLPENKALYFHYERCADEPSQKVVALTNEILKAIDEHAVQRVIVDVRGNGGGNSGFLLAFIQGLKFRETPSRPGSVIVLIGRGTFSSAQMNAAKLKADAGAVLMGEGSGQKPNAYGEVKTFKLPHSLLEVRYSTKYWKTEEGDRPSMEPDVKVEASSVDYLTGKDPVLEAALKYQPGK